MPPGLFFIVSGRVKLASTDSNGQEYILYTLGPSDPFPLAAFFLSEPQPTTYTAMTDVEAIWRPRQEVDEFLNKNPEALREIMTHLIEAFNSRIMDLSNSNSQQRVLFRIMYLAERFGTKTDSGMEISITQQELADSINLTRESISIILNRLQDKGVVKLNRSKISLDLGKVNKIVKNGS